MTVIMRRGSWTALLAAMGLLGVGLVICSALLIKVGSLTRENHRLGLENKTLISALAARDDAFARLNAAQAQGERQRENAMRAFVVALQRQVAALGGQPPPLPPVLRTTPVSQEFITSGDAVSLPSPSSSHSPAPTPAPRDITRPAPLPSVHGGSAQPQGRSRVRHTHRRGHRPRGAARPARPSGPAKPLRPGH